jgi:membrane-associated protein
MKYSSTLPFSALLALCSISLLVYLNVLPPGMELLESLEHSFADYFYLLIVVIILLESIVYVGFYFPGQFFAVVLVVMAEPQTSDIIYLTLAMVVAATLGSAVNFALGRRFGKGPAKPKPLSLKRLMTAMIHINSLAFFMFFQGASRQSVKVIALAGILNMPYYLLLIFATSMLSEQVMQVAENTWLLISLISIWLVIALYLDLKKLRGPILSDEIKT